LVLGAAAAVIVGGAALVSWVVGLAAAVFVVVAMIERARGHALARADELAREVAQVEPLIAMHARVPLRRALPPLREFAIAPDLALDLYERVLDERPAVVVETGSGASTVVIAYALEQVGRGHLWALELDPRHAETTRAELARHGLSRWATVVDAPLAPIELDGATYRWHDVAALDALGLAPIDLVFDDGPPRRLGPMLRYASLPVLAPRMSAGATFVIDVIGDEERAILARWRARHPELAQTFVASKKGHVIIRRASGPAREGARAARRDRDPRSAGSSAPSEATALRARGS
jgi:hypothetical protein